VTVTDSVVAAVLDPSAGLALQVPVTWKDRPGTVRAQMAVSNAHALPLLVGMQVTRAKPWKPTVYLTSAIQLSGPDQRFSTHGGR
jgi:hypothetical protein